MADFADLPNADQQAIGKTLLTLLTGFRDAFCDGAACGAFRWRRLGQRVRHCSNAAALIVHYLGHVRRRHFNRGEPWVPTDSGGNFGAGFAALFEGVMTIFRLLG